MKINPSNVHLNRACHLLRFSAKDALNRSVHGHLRNLIVAKQVNKSRKTIVKPARYLDYVSWNVLKHFRGFFFALRSIIWSGYVQAYIIFKVNWRLFEFFFTDEHVWYLFHLGVLSEKVKLLVQINPNHAKLFVRLNLRFSLWVSL